LGTRLTDRLRRDNTYSFTGVDAMATGQVATVTHRADTIAGITGDGRAHTNLIDTHGFNTLNPGFVNHGACGDQDLVAAWTNHITSDYTTQNTITQRLDNITTFDHWRHGQTF